VEPRPQRVQQVEERLERQPAGRVPLEQVEDGQVRLGVAIPTAGRTSRTAGWNVVLTSRKPAPRYPSAATHRGSTARRRASVVVVIMYIPAARTPNTNNRP